MAAKKKAAAKTAAPKVDPASIPASEEEMDAVRFEGAKGEDRPAARPTATAPTTRRLVAVEVEEEVSSPSDTARVKVVEVNAANAKLKGFRVITVVATRHGHYGLKRQRPGEVFQMGVVGKGYLPSWVKLANSEDQDPEVSRSRQVERNSTGEEIRADVERDAGTEVPTYLGGTQRLPSNEVI